MFRVEMCGSFFPQSNNLDNVLYVRDYTETVQSVTGGKVNILGGHSIGHSKQKSVHCTVHCTLYRRATRHVLTRVAKCIDADCRIFGNVLH
jgi:hypothetical protein